MSTADSDWLDALCDRLQHDIEDWQIMAYVQGSGRWTTQHENVVNLLLSDQKS